MATRTRVVNIRKGQTYDVYIGRSGRGKDGYFGNPHALGFCQVCDTFHTRTEALELFEKEFLIRIKKDRTFRKRVLELRGQRLGCFCKPEACHGDIYVRWLNIQQKEE